MLRNFVLAFFLLVVCRLLVRAFRKLHFQKTMDFAISYNFRVNSNRLSVRDVQTQDSALRVNEIYIEHSVVILFPWRADWVSFPRSLRQISGQVPASGVSSSDDSTITKVVKLLQEMLDKSKEDGTNDRTVSAFRIPKIIDSSIVFEQKNA